MITYAHVSQPPPKPSERRPELPAGLDAIVARGMAKDPAERPESAGALIARRGACCCGLVSYATPKPAAPKLAPPESAPTPASRPRRARPRRRRTAGARTAGARAGRPRLRRPAPAAAPRPAVSARRGLRAAQAAAAGQARALGPALLVLVVAAVFGVLLGMPGSGSERAANTRPLARAASRCSGSTSVRFRLRDDLAVASTPEEQADLAERLAMAYGHAADDLRAPELVSAAQSASARLREPRERGARGRRGRLRRARAATSRPRSRRIAIAIAPQ